MGSIGNSQQPEHDVLVIGAGLSGCYSLYRMRELGLKSKCIEAGTAVGGTWYWNRYPGARFDSESYSYGFSWSPEVLAEWNWTEHFAPQYETEKYLNFICDKFNLREDIQFNTRIQSAKFLDDERRMWEVTDTSGNVYTSRFLITAMGVLSNPTLPNVPGVSHYKGEAFHTARWPKDHVSFEGKRVGIIGTGATAIQAIPEIAKNVGHLTVFQRTPNWAIPLHNAKISPEEMADIRAGYPEMFEKLQKTRMCFIHDSNPDSIWEASPEQREELWEHLYAQPGFGMWLSNYKEILVDHKANDLVSEFVAKKIRQRVKDPETAELLIPKNHGFGTRRVPMETSYYEAYNRPNVRLVDLHSTPIERITEKGLRTKSVKEGVEGEEYDFDMLIYATGFDAVTGAFDAIDFIGTDGKKLKEKWEEGPKTYLGMTLKAMPNMFMVSHLPSTTADNSLGLTANIWLYQIMGPHQAYGNIPRSIEFAVDWVSNCIEHLHKNGLTRIEAREEGVKQWTEHVHQISEGFLSNEIDSWMTGVNKNVAGRQKRIVARYNGSAVEFRQRCRDVAARGYDSFDLA
ncbi:uncharacterized protein LTR77_000978 [Saxophila tyrrhenica]|uniref:Cyclohexanone monooxygenase n=1 Tax=Saxophila tyrrhenica TaxID=1690608 RepID=A0AAV9PU37_9PEZI|nr:hypothetical protein LTR77_000978 [Saxophila tyrrhenica]